MDEMTDLLKWETALQSEIEDLRRRREQLDAEIQKRTKKLELIKQMRLLEEEPGGTCATSSAAIEVRATPKAVKESAQRILKESQGPLHISSIHRQFQERGYPIPGSGTPFNILAHLVNDKTFVRVARGTYALAGSVPQEQVLPKATRKPRKKHRKKRRDSNLGMGEI
jgi:hypothetical protein